MRCEIIDGEIAVYDGSKLVLSASPAVAVHVATHVLRVVKADDPEALKAIGHDSRCRSAVRVTPARLGYSFVFRRFSGQSRRTHNDGLWRRCNDNDIPDECDIAGGESSDCDFNFIPDECQGCAADLDCDGDVGPTDLAFLPC